MRSAAMREAVLNGAKPFPVLRADLVARKMSLGSIIATAEARQLDAGHVTHLTQPGGWSALVYGSGVKDTGLKSVPATVGIIDKDGDLLSLLETYDPRGSVCSIDEAVSGMASVDWEPLFRGVLSDWERDGMYTKLIMKTDDTVLRTPVPSGVFTRAEWGAAYDGTIFGTYMPLVTGIHDSWDVTARGMIASTNIRYDKDIGYWYLASVDRLIEVTRIYYDGVPQGTAGWSVFRGVFGGNYCTIIAIASGSQPAEGVVVAFDCKAMDEDGLITGSTLTGAPDILKAVISEYGYRRPPLSGWRGDHSIIGDGWDTVSEFFALHEIEAARRFGGDQDPESLAEVIDSFLQAYPWVRIWWDELGKLSIAVIDPDDLDPDDSKWLDLQKYHDGGQLPFKPGDRREVYTHLNMPFMWSAAEQKFMSSYEAHDVAALDEKVVLVLENPWSQAQFNEGANYNPAAPADPTVPPDPTPLAFQITLTGTGYATGSVALISGGTWHTNDPKVRNQGANIHTAVGGVITIYPENVDYGGTYDLRFYGSTMGWLNYEAAVTVNSSNSMTVPLSLQKMVGLPIAVGSVTKAIGETLTVAEVCAGDPPTGQVVKGRVYDDANNVIVEDTWNGSAWGGAVSAALAAYSSTIELWWYNDASHDFAMTSLVVS